MSTTKILVTGGAGFIGSHLCDKLLAELDCSLVVIDNLSLGRVANIQHLLDLDNFSFINGDILNDEVLEKIFANNNFDLVFHLAANSDIAQSFGNPSIDLNNTFLTTFRVLENMRKYNVGQIVFSSTSAIYGETKEKLTENFGPLFPVSHYGAGKLASEAFISSFCENYGIQSWIIRFPNVVGERTTHGVIFDFIAKIRTNKYLEVLGNGEQSKPYVYVKDLIEAIFFIWVNSKEKRNYFNVGVDTSTTVKNIASMVIKEMKVSHEIKYTGGDRGWIGDVPSFNYSLEKIHNLGWRAKRTSDEAILLSIQKILANNFI